MNPSADTSKLLEHLRTHVEPFAVRRGDDGPRCTDLKTHLRAYEIDPALYALSAIARGVLDHQRARVLYLLLSQSRANLPAAVQRTLKRVSAMMVRARDGAREPAGAKKREEDLKNDNEKLKAQVDADALRIAELTSQIDQQAQTIAQMQAKVDTLDMAVNELRATQSKAYYVIGNEDVLIKKGIIVKEVGANLLIARVGRTLVPARTLDRDQFTSIDTRQVHEIEMPDTTRRYQIVSRQSLDDAEAPQRDGPNFRGNLKIKDSDKFWAQSKYLIIVER